MEITRKLQLGAAAVIANGLLALTAMTPTPAFANPCNAVRKCGCDMNLADCAAIAPPGCTATSVTCSIDTFCRPPGLLPYTVCHFA
jgi:hypothetical protein